MGTVRTIVVSMLLALGLFVPAAADDVSISLQADKQVVTMADTLTLTVTIAGSRLKSLPTPALPDSPFFQVVGRASGHSFSMVNMKMAVEKTVTYQLMPLRKGRTRLGPASVRVKGKNYKSNTVEVEVADAGNLAPPQPQQDKSETGDAIFLKAEAVPASPYVGGQVTVSLYLYTRVQVSGLSFSHMPDFNNFWVEELLAPQRPTFSEVQINGVPYQAALIRRFAMFGLSPGEKTIGSFGMSAQVQDQGSRRRSRGWPFDEDMFSMLGNRRKVELESPPVVIDVQSLPEHGRPDSFRDTVGRFSMHVKLDKARVGTGDPISLKATVSGEGNFKTLAAPRLSIPPSFNTYSETSDQDIRASSDSVGGTKTFSMILVPREPGQYTLGPITLDYFDPDEGAYKQLTAGPLQVQVTGAGVATAPNGLPITQQEVTASGKDIRYIRGDARRLSEIAPPFYRSGLFLLFVGVWPGLAAAVFFVRRYRKRALADEKKLRYRKAGRVSRTRLKRARSRIDDDEQVFFAELTGAILGYVADKTGGGSVGIVVAKLQKDLADAGASQELNAALADLFSQADAVRYGGRKANSQQRKEALAKARIVLDELDRKKLLKKVKAK